MDATESIHPKPGKDIPRDSTISAPQPQSLPFNISTPTVESGVTTVGRRRRARKSGTIAKLGQTAPGSENKVASQDQETAAELPKASTRKRGLPSNRDITGQPAEAETEVTVPNQDAVEQMKLRRDGRPRKRPAYSDYQEESGDKEETSQRSIKRRRIEHNRPDQSDKPRGTAAAANTGLTIHKAYVKRPSAVYIEPIEVTRDGRTFQFNGLGQVTYQGTPVESTEQISSWYTNRQRRFKIIDYPPKLTVKQWRAILTFRNLDTSGTLEEMQNRMRGWLINVGSDEPLIGPLSQNPQISEETLNQWMERNNHERLGLWHVLSPEQKLQSDLIHFFKDTALAPINEDGEDQKVWVLNVSLKSRDYRCKVLINFLRTNRQDEKVGFIFTTSPQSPSGMPRNTKYHAGKMYGVPWVSRVDAACKNFLGCTLVASGFKTGVIIGKSREAVKKKVVEMAKQIRVDILEGYVEKIRVKEGHSRSSDAGTHEDNRQPFKKSWTKEEKNRALKDWSDDEAQKPNIDLSRFTYRLGLLHPKPHRWSMRKDDFVKDYLDD